MKKICVREIGNSLLNYTIEYWKGEVAEVQLISGPTLPDQTLGQITRGYTGVYSTEIITETELEQLFTDIKRTKLGTPLEMLYFVFLIKDVPRSWTHQAVRTRVGASYVQESTRFLGHQGLYKILVPGDLNSHYTRAIETTIEKYELMIRHGVSGQDARQVLPHALLTKMFWGLSLKTLMGVYNVRWCCQSEPSTWLPVMKQMKEEIRTKVSERIADLLTAPIDRNEPCGFNASFDRPCKWGKT